MLYVSEKPSGVPRDDSDHGRVHLFHFYHSLPRRLKECSDEEAIRSTAMTELLIPMGFFFDHGLRIVNGLVCVAKSEKGFIHDVRLTIYSACTGEKMTIPVPVPYVSTTSTFHLGYVPANRTYKILRLIFRLSKNGQVTNHRKRQVRAHIMTVRPSGSLSTWRKLDYEEACIADIIMRWSGNELYDVVSSENTNGAYGFGKGRFSGDDGVLCWFHNYGYCMLVFDLNEEKFRRLKLPVELARGMRQVVGSRAEFMESGRLALTLWAEVMVHDCPRINPGRIECFVSENEGETWNEQCCLEYPTSEVRMPPVTGLVRIPYFKHRAIYSYRSHVMNNMEEYSWLGNFKAAPHFRIDGLPSFLSDSNHLYLPLDDVLRGVF